MKPYHVFTITSLLIPIRFLRREDLIRDMTIIMETIKSIYYRLGGADARVLKECGTRTVITYFGFALSVIVAVALAFVGGFDVAHQFTPIIWVGFAVGLFWAALIFTFDFLIMNVGGIRGNDKSFWISIADLALKVVRGTAGIANVCITITALLILLNQTKIENQIILNNSDAIKSVDQDYLAGKETRYKLINEKKHSAEKYNEDVVLTEARRGYPGPRYNDKKNAYEAIITAIDTETKKLDEQEKPYLKAYEDKRNAILSQGSDDFFTKVELLPGVVAKGGPLALFMVLCLFIFLASVELGALLLKSTISGDDDYHVAERNFDERQKPVQQEAAQAATNLQREELMLKARAKRDELQTRKHKVNMRGLDDSIVSEAEMRGKIVILRNKGYYANAEALEQELSRLHGVRKEQV